MPYMLTVERTKMGACEGRQNTSTMSQYGNGCAVADVRGAEGL